MSMRVLLPAGWAPPSGYANGIEAPAGRIVFVAGQVGWDTTQRFQSDKLVPQFEQALKNVLAVLAEAGGVPEHICRMTAYCADKPAYLADRRELGRIWRRLMGTHLPGHEHDFCRRPARRSGQDRVGSDCSRAGKSCRSLRESSK
jgi:enamine deaminase RidA (YjgF/YER057c/UK114 family)